MKRTAILFAIFLLLLAGISVAQELENNLDNIPSTYPFNPGAGGYVEQDKGGIFLSGIAIDGSENEYNLLLEMDESQTADPLHIQDSDGTEVFGVESDGALDTAAEIDTASYLLVGNPTPVVITTPAAGDAVVADDMEIQGDLDVAGTSELDGGISVDDTNFVVNGSTGAVTTASTLGVTGLSTLTGGESIPLNVENIGQPTVLSVPITYTAAAGGTGVVATIGANEVWIIHNIIVRTTTSFDCTGDDATLTIGDGNVAAGFINAVDANLQSTYTNGTGFPAGWFGLGYTEVGAYLSSAATFAYSPTEAETIDWVLDETSGETFTAGAATIYVIYTRIL